MTQNSVPKYRPKRNAQYINQKACPRMFTAAQTIVPNQKQAK